nr:MAG TPA: serine recombinase [Caudoviricetes sp.]
MLMSIGKFSKEIGVSISTLRTWDKTGYLKPAKVLDNGYRYYSDEQIDKYLNVDSDIDDRKIVLYARVSAKKQMDDLDRQIENLKTYAYTKGYSFELITDIGSGLNYKKEGLKKLIRMICNKEIKKLVILYKDRLVRFGFELIEEVCRINDVEIEIIDNTTVSKEQELTDDLIQIITVFANRLYGSRSKKTASLIRQVKYNDIK